MGRLEEAEAEYRKAIEIRPDRGAAYEGLMWLLLQEGHVREAEQLVRGFAETYPYSWDAYEALWTFIASGKGELPEALEVVKEATRRNPDNVWPHLFLAFSHAYMMQVKPDPEAAVAAIQRALELRPDSARVLSWAGQIYRILGRLDEAASYHKRAVEVNPSSAEALRYLAEISARQGDYLKAADYARQAISQAPGSWESYAVLVRISELSELAGQFLELISSAAQQYGDDPRILAELGRQQRLAGRFAESVVTYRRALAIKKDGSAFAGLAVSLWLSGDADAALSALEKVNVSDEWFRMVNLLRVSILKSTASHDRIIALLDRLRSEQRDTEQWAAVVASNYYASMRRYGEALATLREVKESTQQTWSIGLTLRIGHLYRLKGDLRRAERILREALPATPGLFGYFVYGELSSLAAVRGDMELAVKLAADGCPAVSPAHYSCLELLGRLEYAARRRGEAADTLKRLDNVFFFYDVWKRSISQYRRAQIAAAAGAPDAGGYLKRALFHATRGARGYRLWLDLGEESAVRALALARSGDAEEAEREVKRAVRLEPERADIAYHAAATYALLGKADQALQWLGIAVERGHQELWWARADPDLDSLRSLPRFQRILSDWDARLRALVEASGAEATAP